MVEIVFGGSVINGAYPSSFKVGCKLNVLVQCNVSQSYMFVLLELLMDRSILSINTDDLMRLSQDFLKINHGPIWKEKQIISGMSHYVLMSCFYCENGSYL